MPTATEGRSARERLLAAADELFYARGINATGVDAIVAHAGVAIATLYHQFGSKDLLVAAYLRRRDERWRRQWDHAIDAATDASERALAIFDALHDWWEAEGHARGCAHVDAAVELTDPQHPARAEITAHKHHLRERLAEMAADDGCNDPQRVAGDLLVIYEGTVTALLMDLDADPVKRARRLARGMLR